MRTSFVKLMTLAICFFAFIAPSNAQYSPSVKMYPSYTKVKIHPALIELNDIQMIDKELLAIPKKDNPAASSIVTSILTSFWDDQAALEKIARIAKTAKPGSYALEIVRTDSRGNAKVVQRGGSLALTDLHQLNRNAKNLGGGEAASSILTSLVTSFWDDQAALAKVQEVLKGVDKSSYLMKPISRVNVSSGALRNVQMYNVKAIMR